MALSILQPGCQPLGQFDFLDTQLLSVKGGEFGVFTYTTANEYVAGADRAAFDVFQDSYADGYRAVVELANSASAYAVGTKFYLLDDGQTTLVPGSVTTTGYGTLFGQVIGTPVGLTFTGANLGPHTAAASGKVTMWDKPGLYAVTVDNVNATLASAFTSVALPGALLYRDANGLLTTGTTFSAEGSVGTFIEFSTNGSLVTTPAKLVGATQVYDRVVFQYNGH